MRQTLRGWRRPLAKVGEPVRVCPRGEEQVFDHQSQVWPPYQGSEKAAQFVVSRQQAFALDFVALIVGFIVQVGVCIRADAVCLDKGLVQEWYHNRIQSLASQAETAQAALISSAYPLWGAFFLIIVVQWGQVLHDLQQQFIGEFR